jgi:O-antigen/teichoic acid export membrane protein
VEARPDREPATDLDILDSGQAGGVFLRGGGLRVLAYIGAVATSIAATPFVTRHLDKLSYGRYVEVASLLLIVAALTEGGIANLGVREFSGGDERARRELMSSLLGLRIALSGAGAAGAILFALLAGYPRVVIEGTVIASVGLVIANLQVTLAVPLTAALRLPWLAVLDFVGPAVTAAGLLLLVAIGAPLLPFFATSVVAYAVVLVITAVLVRRQISIRPSFALRRWRPLLARSVVFAAATALGAIYFQVVVIAMSVLSSGGEVGLFALAFRILSVVNGIPLLLVSSAFPIMLRAARDDHDRLRYAVQRLLEGNLLLGGWLSLLVVAAAPFAVSVMGGTDYAGTGTVLRILGAGVLATFLSAVFAFALLALRMYRTLIALNAGMVALAVVLCTTLIPPFGAQGAAIATLSLEVALAGSYAVALFHAHRELRPQLATAARMSIALALAFVVALLVPFGSLPSAATGSAVLVVAVIALRAIPRELLQALRSPLAVGNPR